jgi:hypothetical protein
MTAPSNAGHYFSYWRLRNASGVIFGIGYYANKSFWAEINVSSGGTAGVAYDFTSNAAAATWYNGTGFGEVKDAPKFESGVTFPSHGMVFQPGNEYNSYVSATYPAFRVQSGDRFQTTVGCEYGATSCYVAYRLDYQIGTGPVRTFWSFREKYEGLTYPANLNLSSLAGYDVKFILVVSAYGSPVGDRAIWGNPIIARSGATIPPTVTGTPPTPTPTKSATPIPAACDRALFVADVSIPDGTVLAPGFTFNKTWRLKNVGTCTWTKDTYKLMFDSGEKMSGPDTAPMPVNVPPGATVDITVALTSPTTAGSYRGYWKFQNNNGIPFGIGTGGTKAWWVDIKVSGTGTVPSTPATPGTPATPVAGTVYDFASNACAAAWYSGAGQLSCPGTDGDAKGFVLKQTSPKLETGQIDTRMGLLTAPQNVTNGYIQGFFTPYTVKSGDRFRSIVNCEGGATSCYVVFRLDYRIGNGTIQTFWAFVEKYEGQYYQADLSLAPLVGQNVQFILTVLATGSAAGDRALWVAPIIFNGSASPASTQAAPSATGTLPLTMTPSLTPTVTNTVQPSATPTVTNTPPTPGG